jgi:hypothetical protein
VVNGIAASGGKLAKNNWTRSEAIRFVVSLPAYTVVVNADTAGMTLANVDVLNALNYF